MQPSVNRATHFGEVVMYSKTKLILLVLCASMVVAQSAHGVVTVAGTLISGPAVATTLVTGTVGAVGGATVAANPARTSSINNDLINGVQDVTFDWGLNGHAITGPDHFHFYAALFRAKQDFFISYLGTDDSSVGTANLFTTNNGISCSAAGSS